jgi:uncharacterized protein (DUF58 family)
MTQEASDLARRIRRVELRSTRLARGRFGGAWHSVFKGQGIDFHEVREYQEGDDVRQIDWNVTARLDRLFVKQFVEERELTVVVAVDTSASLRVGSRVRLKQDLAAEFCATVAFSAVQNHDRVGLYTFDARGHRYVPPGKGRNHATRLLRDLLVQGRDGGATRIDENVRLLHRLLPRHAIVFLVSDFLELPSRAALRAFHPHVDLIAVTLLDPVDRQLPDVGWLEVQDPETGVVRLIDTHDPRLRTRYAETAARHHEARTRLFREAGVDQLVLETDRPLVPVLGRFFEQRARRRLRPRRSRP